MKTTIATALLMVCASAAPSQNLVLNGSFDSSLVSWTNFSDSTSTIEWSQLDASNNPASGSMLVTNLTTNPQATGAGVLQGIPVVGNTTYTLQLKALAPVGQQTTAQVTAEIQFRTGFLGPIPCSNYLGVQGWLPDIPTTGRWETSSLTIKSPPGAECALVILETYKDQQSGSFRAFFDEVILAPEDPPPPAASPPLLSPDYPNFRFWVRIAGSRLGTVAPGCPKETICVAGALPGRAEVFLRIVGPKPNGHLWPNVIKFNTTETEVWVQQVSTGKTKYYHLPALSSDSMTLPGLVDRTGFLP